MNKIMTSPTSSQLVESHGIFRRHLNSRDVAWLNVPLVCKLHYVPIVYHRTFQYIHQEWK